MDAKLVPGEEINSDLGVVNAARVSLAKKSEWYQDDAFTLAQGKVGTLKDEDIKLIHYLSSHGHWTPFAHSRLYFEIHWPHIKDELQFRRMANLAGFAWRYRQYEKKNKIVYTKQLHQWWRGSLYAWVTNLPYLPEKIQEEILFAIDSEYPISRTALLPYAKWEFPYLTNTSLLYEKYVILRKEWYLATATLRVKVPIFVARQIRTSQVAFAYSDYYVEGEAFSFNEVSRRYVNDEPDFYEIEKWRVREGKSVKQGSTGLAEGRALDVVQGYEKSVIATTFKYYNTLTHSHYHIAPEQARALLPQSMYTEFYMTGTLHRWAQFLQLRLQKDVQEETRAIAFKILLELATRFPTWREWYHLDQEPQ